MQIRTQILRRFFSILIALFTLVGSKTGMTDGDVIKTDDFPLISPTAQAEGTVRVMSFNVRYGDVNGTEVGYRIPLVPAQVNEICPDSFGVQEATPLWCVMLNLLLPEYASVGKERDGDGKGEACKIFYRRAKYRLLDSGTFWLSETPEVPSLGWDAACNRVCTWAVLKNRVTGETYVHANTHFDFTGGVAVEESARLITAFLQERFPALPVVFTADMNETIGSAAYTLMTDTLANAALTAEDSIRYGTFHNCSPAAYKDYEIDFVLCSPSLTVKTYRVVTEGINGRFVSDHFPIYADIVIGNGGGIC